ncbi:glycoside hydrolase family 88 protein [Klebsiella sp. S69]|uniref:glycoside hydrolase family 88 protein n=1 Tax=Klebsiella sp. S69 TaxID=2767439 RepID=UPI0019086D4A|nr:glycoside hydrolase family 88 protein [Klebsiella sp. S69]MBK0167392.1 glycoside hydrolase family 88 protein [Klebsiella sp. S69]
MSTSISKETIIPVVLERGERAAIAQKIRQAFPVILNAIDRNSAFFGQRFPGAACINGIYPIIDNQEWTTSFWTGQLWLAWEWTGNAAYHALADQHVRSFGERIAKRDHTNHHDLGFLYSLSCVAASKLTNNREAIYIAQQAAEVLMERYHDKCGIIQAWGELDNPEEQGRMIIDCNMNLPLLYQASETTGDPRYAQAAESHIKQAQRYIVREDGSTFHTYFMDVHTGEPRFGNTHQGFSDDSCWSRGQAWGVYGFLLNYLYTGDEELLELSQTLANYFINRLPEDLICYWDLALTDPNSERDSSASAILACALLELVKQLPAIHPDRESYETLALRMIERMLDSYLNLEHKEGEGLLKHSVYHLKGNIGVNECCSWGDYFLMEAITRAASCWNSYW